MAFCKKFSVYSKQLHLDQEGIPDNNFESFAIAIARIYTKNGTSFSAYFFIASIFRSTPIPGFSDTLM